jgi:PmbA protein
MAFTGEVCLANSHGLELYNKTGLSAAVVCAVIKQGEEASDAYEYACGSTMAELGDLPERVVGEAISKLGAKGVKTGNYNVIFNGKMVRALLSTFSSVFSAKNAQMGLSLLAGKEGETIAAECITICDDPAHEGFSNKTPFDGEGVATYKKNVVENGVLKTLLYDLTTADKAGKASTGNGQRGSYTSSVSIAPYCFSIEGGDISEEMLMSMAGDSIYVTELKGLHAGADAVTGDFSVESAGYLIENGKLGDAVKSFTVSGNFFELIKNVSALSDRVDFGLPSKATVFGAPSMLIKGLSVAGE